MKRLILLFVLPFFVACSNDDNSSDNSSSINPPDWIQGRWIQYYDNISSGMGFEFKTDDFCTIVSSITTCLDHPEIKVDEDVSSTDYTLNVMAGNTSYNYHFQKVSATRIKLVSQNGTETFLEKQ